MLIHLRKHELNIKQVQQIKYENSNGSVIPVRNDVNAADNINPPTTFYALA